MISPALRNLLSALVTNYRAPNDGHGAGARLMNLYAEFLSEFDDPTLEAARRHIIINRKDPFLPTIAEVRDVCEHAKAGTLGDLLDPEGAKKRAQSIRRIRSIGEGLRQYANATPIED